MTTTLRLYVDRMSEPSRAVLLFCKVNGIGFEEIKIDILKRQHLSSEFRAINPMMQLPAIVHGSFKLFESHAILRYLASAFPGVADHWYPADLFKRAKIESVLDWHHSNLRHGAAGLARNRVLLPALGLPSNQQTAVEAEKLLRSTLSNIESIWLEGNGKFLLGSHLPSIADLSLVCQIMQLEVLDENERAQLMQPHKKILQWIDDVKDATKPHFEEVHGILYEAAAKFRSQRSLETNNEL